MTRTEIIECVPTLRVMASILAEFDEIGYREMIHEEAYEEGLEKGKKEGIKEGIRTLIEFAQDCGYDPDVIIQQLAQRFQLSEEEAASYIEKYLKRKIIEIQILLQILENMSL